MIRQRCTQERPSEAGDKRGTAQCQERAPVEFIKPGSGQQSVHESDHSGCLPCERVGDLLWAERVICNPFASETGRKAGRREGERPTGNEESWRSHRTSPPATSSILIHSHGKPVIPNTLPLCQDPAGEEEEKEFCNSKLTAQEEKLSDEAMQHPDSRVRTVWRRWLPLWLKRKHTYNTFTNQTLANCRESTNKPPNGLWRWLSLRRLLLQAGSGPSHLVASDHLLICRSAVGPLQPRFMCSPVMLGNRCFPHDGELVTSPHKDREVQRPFLETRLSPPELPACDTSQRAREEEEDNRDEDKAPGSCYRFRAFHRCTAPELRLQLGEESDSDLEELLVEDEDDDGDEGAHTD